MWDLLSKPHIFPQGVATSADFLLFFKFHLCVCMRKTVRGALNGAGTLSLPHPLPHIWRSTGCCQHLDWQYLFNEYRRIWWYSVICQKKFKYMHIILCHRSLYYDWFFLKPYLCRCFIHELLFLQKLWVSYSFSLAEYAMFFFLLLNLSLYRQYYFWDVNARCTARPQLFVKIIVDCSKVSMSLENR